MSFAVDEIGEAIDTWNRDQLDRLARFCRLDMAITAFAAVFVIVVFSFIREPYLFACGVAVGCAAALMHRAAVVAERGETSTAVAWLAAGNWVAIGTGALAASAVWPIFPLAALFPAIVAATYVRRDQFQRYLIASVAIATLATFAGLFVDLTGIRSDVPNWILVMLQAIFVPSMTGIVGFLAVQNFARTRSALASLRVAHDGARLQANELLASRSRMLHATNRERRRIERDLHDGTQQHFVALGLRLSALKAALPGESTRLHQDVDDLRDDVREAQRNLRNLTAAIYPPTLTQHGLAPAVRAIADRYTSNVTTEIDDVGRCDADVEAAVYFTFMEALQNAAKHAGAEASVTLKLSRDGRQLEFSIADDGAGFVPSPASDPGGLVNMVDRVGAVLGEVEVSSAPGEGTVVSGSVPV